MTSQLRAAQCVFIALAMAAAVATGTAESQETGGGAQANAQSPDQRALEMPWWSVDGGGGTSSGGTFVLLGAAGQPEVGLANACGQVLDGGVWAESVNVGALLCDGFESGGTDGWTGVVFKSGAPGGPTEGGGK